MFRILTLAGGGLRGAYGIGFLAELEARVAGSLTDYFDLISGTSTGAITASALAYGFSADDMQAFYEKHGSRIFTPRPKMEAKGLGKLCYPLARYLTKKKVEQNLDDVFRSRYCPDMLEASMVEGFGDKTVSDIKNCRLLIPVVDLTAGRTCVFRTPHLPTNRPEYGWTISDIILAATAAPTFFPHKNMPDGKSYADGGLWANDPSLVAISEAARILRCQDGMCSKDSYGAAFDSSGIKMLSIGTGQSTYSLSPPDDEAGIMYWSKHVAGVMGALQVQGDQFPLKVTLGERYHPVDFELKDKSWTLDNVDMMEELFELGREEGRRQFEELKECFFKEKAPKYKPMGLYSES